MLIFDGCSKMDHQPQQKKPAQMATKSQHCGILLRKGDSYVVVGGMKIGFLSPDKVRAELIYGKYQVTAPFVGVRLSVDASQDDAAKFYNDLGQGGVKLAKNFAVTIRFLANTFESSGREMSEAEIARLPERDPEAKFPTLSVVTIKPRKGCKPIVSGIGMPMITANPHDAGYLNGARKFSEVMTLQEYCRQSEFEFIFPNTAQIPRAQNEYNCKDWRPESNIFSYSNGLVSEHPRQSPHLTDLSPRDWDMARYRTEIPTLAGDKEYDYGHGAHLDSALARHICITQGIVQDVFWLSEDVDAIRAAPVKCTFIRTGTDPDKMAPEFTVLVWYSWEVSVPGSHCCQPDC